MMRKLAIAVCMVALSTYPFLQAFCAAGLMMVYLVSHVAASPFEHQVLNDLESFSLFCSAFTLQCCMLYTRREDPMGEDGWITSFEDSLSLGLVILNVFFSILMLACIASAVISSLKRAARGKEFEEDRKKEDHLQVAELKAAQNPLYSQGKQEDTAYPAIKYSNPHNEENGTPELMNLMMSAGDTTTKKGDFHVMTSNPLAATSGGGSDQ